MLNDHDTRQCRRAHLSWDFPDHLSCRVVDEINGSSRVVYDISGRPPATIGWE